MQFFLTTHCKENDSSIESLTISLQNKNLKQFEIQIHGIKSAAKTLGAISLSEQASELESAAHCNDYDALHILTEQFLSMNTTVVDAFQNYMSDSSGNDLAAIN